MFKCVEADDSSSLKIMNEFARYTYVSSAIFSIHFFIGTEANYIGMCCQPYNIHIKMYINILQNIELLKTYI